MQLFYSFHSVFAPISRQIRFLESLIIRYLPAIAIGPHASVPLRMTLLETSVADFFSILNRYSFPSSSRRYNSCPLMMYGPRPLPNLLSLPLVHTGCKISEVA